MTQQCDQCDDQGDLCDQCDHDAIEALIAEATNEPLRLAAGAGPAPTHEDIVAWWASCPPEVLNEVTNRLNVLFDRFRAHTGQDVLGGQRVKVNGWQGGAFVLSDTMFLYAADASSTAAQFKIDGPLPPLVRAWQRTRPIQGRFNMRLDRILPAKLAMVAEHHPRAGRLLKLFSPAAHRRGQLSLPEFEHLETRGPALPLQLYQLGQRQAQKGGGPGAPLALRLFIEAVMAVDMKDRRSNNPVALQVTLRDLLDRLYPGPRKPRPNEYWPRLVRAAEALDSMDARFPWQDPKTGHWTLLRVVSVGGIPRGPDALDDLVRIVVDLPPGSGEGPSITPTLGAWGVRSAPAYNALINLAYRWFDPGVTRHPVGGGRWWVQALDPERYPELSDADVVAITRPLSARAARRNLAREGWETLHQLEAAGELRIEGRRVLPLGRPSPHRGDVSPCR